MDVTLAALGLLVLSPVLALVVVAILVDSRGPVVFRHTRLGLYGHEFSLLKFRSMFVDAEDRLNRDPTLHGLYVEHDYKLPEKLDPRITKLGRWLRRTSLDELPQLWNVLRGDMSLVGPRPIVPAEIEHYQDEARLLMSQKPGITGAWQVDGRSQLHYPDRTLIELEYVRRWSLGRDVWILLRTIPAVFSRRGAY